jgi:hypothetical protein
MSRNRTPRDTGDSDGPERIARERRRTPIEVPTDRPASLGELAAVSRSIVDLELRVDSIDRHVGSLERVHAEFFGVRGDNGVVGRLGDDVKSLIAHTDASDVRITAVEKWRVEVVAKWAVLWVVGSILGGGLAAGATLLVQHFLK